jgi:hypothetical protein
MPLKTREQLRVALEDVLKVVRARPRRHDHEPTPELEHAYPQLLIALAFARIEERHRARELFDQSRTAIASDPKRAEDVVHTFLLTTFALRFEEALGGQPMVSFLCDRTRAALGEVVRIPRYKIDSFREQLPTIDAPSRTAMMDAYSNRGPVPPPPADVPPPEVIDVADIGEPLDRKQGVSQAQRLLRLRAIARGYARAPVEIAADGMRRLSTVANDLYDAMSSTSSHFGQSLVHLVASICLITETEAH